MWTKLDYIIELLLIFLDVIMVVMKEYVLILRKYALKNLGMKCDYYLQFTFK